MSEDTPNSNPNSKPEPHLKGGGFRGGPRRWTGTGPRPARHVPWPELFKHHESVLTGHLKMMDMVKKHCVEGTGNWDTAHACVERTRKMMSDFKMVKRNFVPPRDNVDRVPLGASSASVYPGYSPADHIYGEAAQEYGQQAAEAKRQGVEFPLDPQGPEYVVGQTVKAKKEQLAKVSDRLRNAPQQVQPTEKTKKEVDNAGKDQAMKIGPGREAGGGESQPMFFIDSNPTLVALNGSAEDPRENKSEKQEKKRKRRRSQEADKAAPDGETSEEPQTKKAKISLETNGTADDDKKKKQKKKDQKKRRVAEEEDSANETPITEPEPPSKKNKTLDNPVIEEDNIDAEVEARMREKAEKRKRKEEKKRKRERESGGDSSVLPEATNGVEHGRAEGKPKKKAKRLDMDDGQEPAEAVSGEKRSKEKKKKKRRGEGGGLDADGMEAGEVQKKKKPKTKKDD